MVIGLGNFSHPLQRKEDSDRERKKQTKYKNSSHVFDNLFVLLVLKYKFPNLYLQSFEPIFLALRLMGNQYLRKLTAYTHL